MICPECDCSVSLSEWCSGCKHCDECCECEEAILGMGTFDEDEFGEEPEDEYERRTRG